MNSCCLTLSTPQACPLEGSKMNSKPPKRLATQTSIVEAQLTARLPGEASSLVADAHVQVAGVVALARRLVARQLRRRDEDEGLGRGVARSQAAAREALCGTSALRNPRVQRSASTRATALALTIVLG
eukprot:CAMPEP_0177379700 /NCGR_PEP_ID=MMETSP0368-20130122/47081_1 /TAXON_ID=447022 ORGANISM="Scrippsiella hangoei-like, Strain SHHI-4" /NCGR_SAMPLE_ID=MMETSP0368 /ASSEMBLY_ACC=CAM_ASM_000363 /LENGTH=127 /DNA_ID=CAMNT_0018843881 /DNA_START=108 /DNA_END=487 /DNA_ORIENTATION=+